MGSPGEPSIGAWYRDVQLDCLFEVVAMDDDTVEIQYFDGSVEEWEHGTWRDHDLEETQPPEDWSGPFDDIAFDDLGCSDIAARPLDWCGPLTYLEGGDGEVFDETA